MAPTPSSFADDLGTELSLHADDATREWWTDYLKGEAAFRGVKMAVTRRVVRDLVRRHQLTGAPAEVVLDLAHACMARPHSEDKLGGVLLLAEHGLAVLELGHAEALARPLAVGDLADWNVCDWYCVKVLGPFVAAGDDVQPRAEAIAGWCRADTLWQRRAAAVAFVNLAPKPAPFAGFADLLVEVGHANAADPTRWSQTSVGWLMRELSVEEPEVVRRFVDEHPHLSAEARKAATARLPSA